MSGHKTTIAGGNDAWQGRCSCEARGPVMPHRWEADDWTRDHLDQVARVRSHLKKQPSLKDQYQWFMKQAGRATDKETKDMWLMLADGLSHRLGVSPHDEPLWKD